jgi:hypothetical protein
MGQAMKAHYTLMLIFVSGFKLAAQPWSPSIGAQWWNTYSQVGGLYGTVTTVYTADSLISGESWQKLDVRATYQDLSSSGPVLTETWIHLTRTIGPTVLLRSAEEVDTLYRFDAQIADRWSVPFTTTPELTYVVTGVGDSLVGGLSLNWVAVDVVTNDDGLYFTDTLIERLGFLDQFIFPAYSLNLEPDLLGLRCYSDADVDFQRQPGMSCDVGLQVQAFGSGEEQVSVRFDEPSASLEVRSTYSDQLLFELVDVHGKALDRGVVRSGVTILDVATLAGGVYLLRFADGPVRVTATRWVRP